jgi:hypothetical protein
MTVIGAMLAGADSIDDVDILRAGAAPELFDQIRAPSTIGTWLRGFNWASVRMLDAVSRGVLARAWQAGLGPELDDDLTIDLDSTVCQVYGVTAKQGAKFGYTKVRGYHPLLATLAGTNEVLHARMRGGNAGSARGAASLVRETISRVRDAGATGALTLRADSAFYSKSFVRACRDHDARFSVTVKQLKPIKKAIAAIPEEAWVPIDYWLEGGADVAETTYTAFTNTKHEVTLRLIVRRVRPTPGSQLALDVVFDYHPILTDRHGDMLEIEADHRAHAVVELAIRDVKAGGLAHVPSGKFNANAAWLALAILAHNLGRWSLKAAGQGWQRRVPWSQDFRSGTREDRMLREVTVSLPPHIAERRCRAGRATLSRPWRRRPGRSSRSTTSAALSSRALGAILLRTESVASSKIERVEASTEDYARALHGNRSNAAATAMAAATTRDRCADHVRRRWQATPPRGGPRLPIVH